jgi:D-amino-acid dehydrogenase
MRIAVIGAGIVGVTSAYELALDGHELSVFERRGSIAAEASFATGGLMGAGHVRPWAAPGLLSHWLQQSLSRHSAYRLARMSPRQWAWMWQMARGCRPALYRQGRQHMHRLARFSQARFDQLRSSLKLDYEQQAGHLILIRGPRERARVQRELAWWDEVGEPHAWLSPEQARALEPALSTQTPFEAAVHLPGDGVANCRQFAHLLKDEAQRLGVRFHFHHEVRAIEPGAPVRLHLQVHDSSPDSRPTQVPGASGAVEVASPCFDAVVVCAAMGAPALLTPIGLRLPLMAVHGYAVTAPMRVAEAAMDNGPRASLTDERYKVSISRLGARVRVTGGAEFGGSPTRQHPAPLATLYKVLEDWFPGAARTAQAMQWKGSRPMLPDGPPVLGPSGLPGVWLNLGHGDHGWALSTGSARILADHMMGRAPSVDVQGLGLERLR